MSLSSREVAGVVELSVEVLQHQADEEGGVVGAPVEAELGAADIAAPVEVAAVERQVSGAVLQPEGEGGTLTGQRHLEVGAVGAEAGFLPAGHAVDAVGDGLSGGVGDGDGEVREYLRVQGVVVQGCVHLYGEGQAVAAADASRR